ncbi:HU family DNA-binding protein [Ferrimonas marina]|uniref:Integration host factor subunit alpha n=1 Tax=Ferrimonas marina TaxID=299255 RepID=A0A1M5T9H3_9GAMM|nr:HU family DNA-binding protein [Ferrimonas marina]SHH47417.1 integration host factor subunit alpha [Ferrimonas marina]
MTVTKEMMAEHLIKANPQLKLTKTRAKMIVQTILERMHSNLASGKEVRLSGFGNFKLTDKNPRPGRNPKTKEPAMISARRVVSFVPGSKLKDQVA